MKTAIIYYSRHHQNTKKLLDAIATREDVCLIDAVTVKEADLSDYHLIGFASGIYYGKFHQTVLEFAQKSLPAGKKVFCLYTYGAPKDSYLRGIKEIIQQKGCQLAGSYG